MIIVKVINKILVLKELPHTKSSKDICFRSKLPIIKTNEEKFSYIKEDLINKRQAQKERDKVENQLKDYFWQIRTQSKSNEYENVLLKRVV